MQFRPTSDPGWQPLASNYEPENQGDNTCSVPFVDTTLDIDTTASGGNFKSTSHKTQSSGFAGTANSAEGSICAEHIARLRKRGLDPNLCAELGVHTINRQTLGFHYKRNGEVWDTKLRRGKGNMPWARGPAKGRALIPWNFDVLEQDPAPDEFLIVTEGEFDGIACIQVGYSRTISVPNGAQSGDQGFAWLYKGDSIHPQISKFQHYVIATDGDEKGLAARDALAVRLGDDRCKFVEYPKGCKDANDVLRDHGAEKLRELIENARPMWVDELCKLSDIPDPGEEIRYRLGIPSIDAHGFRITLPALWTIVGPYGCGKSVLLRQIMFSLWRTHGWRVALTAFEERVKPRMERDLSRHIIGRPRLPDNPWTPTEIKDAREEIDNGFRFIVRPKRKLLEPNYVLERVHTAIRRDNCKAVALDPMNEIDWRPAPGQMKTDLIGDFLMALKDLGEDYGVLMIVCAHTMKNVMFEKAKAKQTPILRLSDAEDTRYYGNKSDIGWAVWRLWDGPTLVHVDKLKDEETMGRRTLIELTMNRGMNAFEVTRTGYDIVTGGKNG